jgi:hypothetical protein
MIVEENLLIRRFFSSKRKCSMIIAGLFEYWLSRRGSTGQGKNPGARGIQGRRGRAHQGARRPGLGGRSAAASLRDPDPVRHRAIRSVPMGHRVRTAGRHYVLLAVIVDENGT